MRYPSFLNKQSYIYMTSPSMGCATSYYKPRLDKAILNVKEYFPNIIKGKYIYNPGLLSSSPLNLAKEFEEAYSKSNLVWSVGGGEIMIKILEYIDFNTIKNLNPSWFMGYSDNTNLTFLLPTICDVAAIYGGNVPEFGSDKIEEYQADQLDLLLGKKIEFNGYKKYEIESLKSTDNPYASLNLTEDSKITTIPANLKEIKGRLIGGCIDVLSCLVGTKYDNMKEFNNKYDDIIFFFEACDMTPIEVSRRLIQFKHAGWFSKTKAIIFGRPVIDKDTFENDYKDLIYDSLKDLNIPLAFGFDIGHVKPQIPVIVGSIATIIFNGKSYKIKYELK